jgi:hypothetical protein
VEGRFLLKSDTRKGAGLAAGDAGSREENANLVDAFARDATKKISWPGFVEVLIRSLRTKYTGLDG